MTSTTEQTRQRRVLVIGFDPAAVPGMDAGAIQEAFDHTRGRAAQLGLNLDECLIAPDAGALDAIDTALRSADWDCVVVGGGIRKPEVLLELFEAVVNRVHRMLPGAAIAFNTSPADSADAAARALAL
jgi:hypothetical protein